MASTLFKRYRLRGQKGTAQSLAVWSGLLPEHVVLAHTLSLVLEVSEVPASPPPCLAGQQEAWPGPRGHLLKASKETAVGGYSLLCGLATLAPAGL